MGKNRKSSNKQEKTIVDGGKRLKKRESIVDDVLEDKDGIKWLVDEDGLEMMSDVTDESTTDESTSGEQRKTRRYVSRVKVDNVEPVISKRDRVLFNKVTRKYQDTVEKAEQSFMRNWRGKDDPNPHPKKIRLSNFEIHTCYTSLYPVECAVATTLHICDFCLRYFVERSFYEAHISRCQLRHPPGNEIYRNDGISVYEVDGYDETDYCRRACLLGKCFIDCKSSVNNGSFFLFYVLTKNDEYGQHFVGYFSKSKEFRGNALSCIAILPCFQGYKYGSFLVELSYFLMQRQGLKGTPERPLTQAGHITYSLYWRSKILEWFGEREDQLPKEMNLDSIAKDTGITVEDLANTMDLMDWFGPSKENPEEVGSIDVKWAEVKDYMKNKQPGITFNKDSFKWTPGVYDCETGKRKGVNKIADDETGKCEQVDRKHKLGIVQIPTQETRDQGLDGVTASVEAGFAVIHNNAKGLVSLEASNVHYDQPSTSLACFNTPRFNSARQGPLIRSKRRLTDVVKLVNTTEVKREASPKPQMFSMRAQTDVLCCGDNGDDVLMRAFERQRLGISFTEDGVKEKNTTQIKQQVASTPEHKVIRNSVPLMEKLRHTRRPPEPWQLDFKAFKKFRWSDLELYAWNETNNFGEVDESLHEATTKVSIFRRCVSLSHF